MNKNYRQSQILKLIRARSLHTQDELARALRTLKIPATQVTLSRDIRELGLVKTPAGWKIAFRHTSMLPPDFGVEPDYHQDRGGMRFAEVVADGPAGKAAFKSGDVLVEYGGRKIDNPTDYDRLRHSYYEGEKVIVTVIRGKEKITKEVTLEKMR